MAINNWYFICYVYGPFYQGVYHRLNNIVAMFNDRRILL